MVYLAIHPPIFTAKTNLRVSSFWFPTLPDLSLSLSELKPLDMEYFEYSMNRFKPLLWCHFGGHRGRRLRSLRSVVGYCEGINNEGSMTELSFLDGSGLPKRLGRATRLTTATTFTIDGPGGERIVRILAAYKIPGSAPATEDLEGHLHFHPEAQLQCIRVRPRTPPIPSYSSGQLLTFFSTHRSTPTVDESVCLAWVANPSSR